MQNSNQRNLVIQGSTLAAIVILVAVSASGLLAQTAATGGISGTVTDPSGAFVPQASVKVTNLGTNELREVETGGTGTFLAGLLAPGLYRVEVSKPGFVTANANNVQVNVTETTKVPFTLTVGSESASIRVEADATMVQTESSTLGRVVDDKVVESLPLVTRNFTQILALSPGITGNLTNAGDLGRGSGGLGGGGTGVGYSAHGDRTYDNNFEINGLGVNDVFQQGATSGGIPIPNPDTIQEFKVQTGQYDAAYGRNAGANVNLVTRGGTNQFHGALFEFFRNTDLNANNFFSNLNGQKRPVLNQNQFGFTLGGPIVRNKLLFFGSYQGTRQVNGVASLKTVVSVPLTNDRSAQGIANVLYGAGSTASDRKGVQQNAMGGVGPAILPDGSNINPVALSLLQLKLPDGSYAIPTPQSVSSTGALSSRGSSTFATPSNFNEDQYLFDVDFLHTSSSKFSGKFFAASSDQTVALSAANVPGFAVGTGNFFIVSSLAHTWVLTPTLLNEARMGFDRLRTTQVPQAPFKFSDVGIAESPQNNALPMITISGSYAMVVGQFAQRVQNTFLWDDSLSWTHGRHTFRFGGSADRVQRNFTNPGQNASLTFQSFADFLLGLNAAGNGTNLFSNIFTSVNLTGLFNRAVRLWEAAAYVQDDYRLSPSLTLNLGVRYDFLPPPTEMLGRFSNVDVSQINPNPPATGTSQGFVVAANFPGTLPAGVAQTKNDTVYHGAGTHDFAPRVGLAWNVLPGSSRVVVRAGYGIYYSRITGQVLTQNTTVQPFGLIQALGGPQNAAATFANPFANPLTSVSSFPMFVPYTPSTSLTATAVDPNARPGIIGQYDLNVQYGISSGMLLEAGYVGSRGTRLIRIESVNQALLASAANPIRGATTDTVANIAQRVPYQGWTSSGLAQVQTEGSMWYNALQVSLTKRFSKGLQMLASYTWSKTLDSDGANVEANANAGSAIGNQLDWRQRYGPSSFSRPHRVVVSYLYELPFMKGAAGWKQSLLGGWEVTGVTTVQAGHPLTLIGTNASNVFGITGDRAQLAPGCSYDNVFVSGSVQSKLGGFFNSSCINRVNLAAPLGTSNPAAWPIYAGTATTFGSSGVGIVRGPDQNDFDIGVDKKFATHWPNEAANVGFRAEFFNTFNTPNFSDPDTSVSNSTFGRITSTSVASRIIQFSLKLKF